MLWKEMLGKRFLLCVWLCLFPGDMLLTSCEPRITHNKQKQTNKVLWRVVMLSLILSGFKKNYSPVCDKWKGNIDSNKTACYSSGTTFGDVSLHNVDSNWSRSQSMKYWCTSHLCTSRTSGPAACGQLFTRQLNHNTFNDFLEICLRTYCQRTGSWRFGH